MRDQKGQKRIFQIREVERLAAHLHLVGGQVDGQVVHRQIVGRRPLAARPQKLADARGALARAGAMHDEVGLHLDGQAEFAQLVLADDDQHRCRSVLHQQLLGLRHARKRVPARLVHDQIAVRMLREQLPELQGGSCRHVHVQAGEHLLELVRVVKAVGHEDDGLALHHPSLPPRMATAPPGSDRAPTASRNLGRRSSRRASRSPGRRGCARRASRA